MTKTTERVLNCDVRAVLGPGYKMFRKKWRYTLLNAQHFAPFLAKSKIQSNQHLSISIGEMFKYGQLVELIGCNLPVVSADNVRNKEKDMAGVRVKDTQGFRFSLDFMSQIDFPRSKMFSNDIIRRLVIQDACIQVKKFKKTCFC